MQRLCELAHLNKKSHVWSSLVQQLFFSAGLNTVTMFKPIEIKRPNYCNS